MAINTTKKIKKVSYNQTEIPSGVDVSNVNATRGDILGGKRFVDENGNVQAGKMLTYDGSTSRTTNGTFSTANRFLTTDLTVNVNAGNLIFRYINPTIIEITTTSSNESISIKFSRASSSSNRVEFYLGWGDGSSKATIPTSSATTTLSHTYSTAGTYEIVLAPTTYTNSRFYLAASKQNNDILLFSQDTFGQSNSSHFTKKIKIIVGDCVGFEQRAFGWCDNIEVLDFSSWNSLLEKSDTYYTQKAIPSYTFGVCNIGTLILGNSIFSIDDGAFVSSTVNNIIIKEPRSSGMNANPITAGGSNALPATINGKISINTLKLNAYQNASYWSAFSSKMVEF